MKRGKKLIIEKHSLPVPNSHFNAERIRQMIIDHQDKISEIFVIMDTHEKFHIAHPSFWVSPSNENLTPPPYTKIMSVTEEPEDCVVTDEKGEKWKPANPAEIEGHSRVMDLEVS